MQEAQLVCYILTPAGGNNRTKACSAAVQQQCKRWQDPPRCDRIVWFWLLAPISFSSPPAPRVLLPTIYITPSPRVSTIAPQDSPQLSCASTHSSNHAFYLGAADRDVVAGGRSLIVVRVKACGANTSPRRFALARAGTHASPVGRRRHERKPSSGSAVCR